MKGHFGTQKAFQYFYSWLLEFPYRPTFTPVGGKAIPWVLSTVRPYVGYYTKTVSRCFGALRQLRCCVPASTLQSLVQALVVSRLDYGNGVMIVFTERPLCLSDAAATVGSQCGCTAESLDFGGLTTSEMRSSSSIGCAFPSASSSRLPFSLTTFSTAVHHRTSDHLPSRPTYLVAEMK